MYYYYYYYYYYYDHHHHHLHYLFFFFFFSYFQTSSKDVLLSVSLLHFSCPPCLEYLCSRAMILLRLWRYINHVPTYYYYCCCYYHFHKFLTSLLSWNMDNICQVLKLDWKPFRHQSTIAKALNRSVNNDTRVYVCVCIDNRHCFTCWVHTPCTTPRSATVRACVCTYVCVYRQQALFHVLGAYSMYNTEVGYCQGMCVYVCMCV